MKRLLLILVLVLLGGIVSASAAELGSMSVSVSQLPISQDESYDYAILDGLNSEGVAVTENSVTFNSPSKDNNSNCHYFSVRSAHSINLRIAIYQSSFAGVVRAVDKYIYFLHHIII